VTKVTFLGLGRMGPHGVAGVPGRGRVKAEVATTMLGREQGATAMDRIKQGPGTSRKRESMTREPRITYRFKRARQFEFWFQWIVGAQTHGTAEAAECFSAASGMRDGQPDTWRDAWTEQAQRAQARAETARQHGHAVSAREAYLRAYTYYRAALLFMRPRTDPRYRPQLAKARTCFRTAATLFDPPFEVLAIPFDGATLPGYFLKPDASGTPRPTLLMIGGGDTIVEDLYAYIGPAGLKRGYNVLMVDLPGQGDLPFVGLVMRPDAEVPMRAVVGYALGRPDVDPERLAAYGISGGGYLVPRAATRERRLRACVANSLVLDLTGIWGERLAAADRSLLYRTLLKLPLPQIRSALVLLDTYMWRWGVETLPDLYEVSKAFTLDPGEITCPILNVVAEQEWEVVGPTRRWAELCRERAPHPRSRLVVTPATKARTATPSAAT